MKDHETLTHTRLISIIGIMKLPKPLPKVNLKNIVSFKLGYLDQKLISLQKV
jgi:hypothetical protein